MKKIALGVVLLLLVTGCSGGNESSKGKTNETTSSVKASAYDSALAKGKEALIEKDMSKAQASFQLALEYKKEKEAQALLKQVSLYKEATESKEKKEYAASLEKLAELSEIKGGSTLFKSYIQEMIKELAKENTYPIEYKKKEETKETTEKVQESSSVEETPKVEAKSEPNVPWNQEKRTELVQFMAGWGQSMDQSYIEYSPNMQVNWYGINFPSTFANNNIAVNGSRVAVQWSDSGLTDNVYNVVAIYSDMGTTGATMNNHLYLFTIFNGQAIVLITQQNQGNAENLVYFTTTQNADLNSGFAQIVGG
ncbi:MULTISPECIES: DUF4767 domain-containing protein [unclassified Enterococcus]|uniref:DUF4767 domain-containing protein n=1 Tax=unclassified Enterococcus TaxID=2608891 RepID=UPI001CE190C0|nr:MULTISPECIES: DUF4767 domain-containing protein [unclassified Enterococcus]MCA5012121.1 DUF4767 domain-containing protein [Enterococcus sp. S23]MCA5015372.1 DUF4767 domain-containing protein [Enterococcus sp. S22(2020)]